MELKVLEAHRHVDRQVRTQTGSYTSQQLQTTGQTDEGEDFLLLRVSGIQLRRRSGIHRNVALAFSVTLERAVSAEGMQATAECWDSHQTETSLARAGTH